VKHGALDEVALGFWPVEGNRDCPHQRRRGHVTPQKRDRKIVDHPPAARCRDGGPSV